MMKIFLEVVIGAIIAFIYTTGCIVQYKHYEDVILRPPYRRSTVKDRLAAQMAIILAGLVLPIFYANTTQLNAGKDGAPVGFVLSIVFGGIIASGMTVLNWVDTKDPSDFLAQIFLWPVSAIGYCLAKPIQLVGNIPLTIANYIHKWRSANV